jgi:hypothetical protein
MRHLAIAFLSRGLHCPLLERGHRVGKMGLEKVRRERRQNLKRRVLQVSKDSAPISTPIAVSTRHRNAARLH